MYIHCFTFNAFAENTYVVYNSKGTAWLIDPGCSSKFEENELLDFINSNNLTIVRIFLTHAHIDHILGCDFLYRKFGLIPEAHPAEQAVYESAEMVSQMYGVPYISGPKPTYNLFEGAELVFDDQNSFRCIFSPGHSPGSICFYNSAKNVLLAGDVLFDGSIGRTDLPGGNYDELIHSIKSKLLVLPADTIVFPGHGPSTTISEEKLTNPFLV